MTSFCYFRPNIYQFYYIKSQQILPKVELHVCGVYLVRFFIVLSLFFVCLVDFVYLNIVVVIVVLSLSHAVDICVQDYGYTVVLLLYVLTADCEFHSLIFLIYF